MSFILAMKDDTVFWQLIDVCFGSLFINRFELFYIDDLSCISAIIYTFFSIFANSAKPANS
ncbi:hypothetical protein, partial [Neobacillus vireti]|uniref:hypothetical protein n=1 Tax=Neobacillus vireti TaxID=220686 RepID=UPI002FFFECB8